MSDAGARDLPRAISPLPFSALMTAHLAHELRSLLGVAADCAAFMRDRAGLDAPGRQDLAAIDRAVAGAIRVSHELSTLAHPRSLEPTSIDVNQLLRESRGLWERALGDNIQLNLRVNAGWPYVRGEAVRLEWILLNLMLNARATMPDGGIVEIATALILPLPSDTTSEDEDEDEPARLRITVTDTGTGVPEAARDRLFEPFATTGDSHAGLSLTAVFMNVSELGGSVAIESYPAIGTSIHVDLPVDA